MSTLQEILLQKIGNLHRFFGWCFFFIFCAKKCFFYRYLSTDMLLIITSTGDKLLVVSTSMTLNNLEPPT